MTTKTEILRHYEAKVEKFQRFVREIQGVDLEEGQAVLASWRPWPARGAKRRLRAGPAAQSTGV